MSDKLIRDELLRSHRFQSLSGDTPKLLFMVLLLSSDNLSNAEYNTTNLSAIMGRAITEEAAATLLAELVDHDLVGTYLAGGKRYVHIPRSRQRIRYLRGKHPRPPEKMEDKEISALIAKVGLKSDPGQAQDGPFTPYALPCNASAMQVPSAEPPVHNSVPVDKWWSTLELLNAKAKALGIRANPGESKDALYKRVKAELDRMRSASTK